jgi:GT2 family glycosyltransferase
MNNAGAKPEVAVIVVAYHGDKWIAECLSTLERGCSGRWKLILVDNGGTTRIDALKLSGLDCQVLKTPRPMGFAEANNFALQQHRPDTPAVCFLNQDTRSEPGWLDACLTALREDATIGAASPELRTYDGSDYDPHFLACVEQTSVHSDYRGRRPGKDRCFDVERMTAAAMVVKADALMKAGPFDPVFESYYEDYDLCLRLKRLGYRLVICPSGRVAHYSGSSTRDRAAEHRRARQVLRNRQILRFRAAGDRRWPSVLKYLLVTMPYGLARSMARTTSAPSLRAYGAAQIDLLRLLPRIGSASRDARAWRRYLAELGWPSSGSPAA